MFPKLVTFSYFQPQNFAELNYGYSWNIQIISKLYTETLIAKHTSRFTYFCPLIKKEQKIFGLVSKNVLCHIESLYYEEAHALKIIKCIHKFANLQNVGMEQTVHNCLLPSFHYSLWFVSIKNSRSQLTFPPPCDKHLFKVQQFLQFHFTFFFFCQFK